MRALQNAQSGRGGSFTICAAAGTPLVFVGDLTASSFSARVLAPGEGAAAHVRLHVPRVVGSMLRYALALISAGSSTTCRRVRLPILIGSHPARGVSPLEWWGLG